MPREFESRALLHLADEVTIKPQSWAASHAADHVVRTFGRRPAQFAEPGASPSFRSCAAAFAFFGSSASDRR